MPLRSASRPMRVLVRSSWQVVNIGDVAHSPGLVRALNRFAPDLEVGHWPVNLGDRERALFAEHLPGTVIVDGEIGPDGRPTTDALRDAFDSYDLLIHGSAAGLAAGTQLRAWRDLTGKPFGFFGVTIDPFTPSSSATLDDYATMIDTLPADHLDDRRELLEDAAFVLCRDSLTRRYLLGQGLDPHRVTLGPDGTWSYDIRDEQAAESLLEQHGLTSGSFLCAVPRLRWTPYHRIRHTPPTHDQMWRDAVNAVWTPRDMAVLRDVVSGWIRATGQPALLCPEMVHEVELIQEYLSPGRFPADVADRVLSVGRYWSLEEATATYARATAVVSMECHSPIMAAVAGTPAIYLRQPTDTVKGAMYGDLGLGEHVVEVDGGAQQAIELLRAFSSDPSAARARTTAAITRADDLFRHGAEVVTAATSAS